MTPLQFSDIVRPLVSPTSSVATPWVFSQDRGCFQCPILGLSFLYSGNTACFLHPGLRHQIYNCLPTKLTHGWFPNFTRAYDNNGRCPRQKFVFGILQLYESNTYYSFKKTDSLLTFL